MNINEEYLVAEALYKYLVAKDGSMIYEIHHISFNNTRKELFIICDIVNGWYSVAKDIQKIFKNDFGLVNSRIEPGYMNDFSPKQIEYVIFSDITYQEMYALLKLKDVI